MTDRGRKMPPDIRRRVMASMKSRDTVPEWTLRSALWKAGIRGWRCHYKSVPGSPDVAFTRWRVAVFVDGVWWHGHPDYLPRGSRGPYWDKKIARNKERDKKVNRQLRERGWKVIRIWDVEVLDDPGGAVEIVAEALSERGWEGEACLEELE